MKQVKLEVKGMQCNHCAQSIYKTVSSIRGIISVDVSLANNTVTVEFAEDMVDLDQITLKIKRLGYEVVE
jgi:copper ion binding protein